MGRFVPARWHADLTAAGPRRARLGGTYLAYVPDPLVGRVTLVDLRVAADVADAEAALTRLDAAGNRVQGADRLEVLARLLLRAEAVGSSQIEGLVVSPRKLALAAFDPSGDPSGRAVEVLGNIDALRDALALHRRRDVPPLGQRDRQHRGGRVAPPATTILRRERRRTWR